MYIFCVCLNGVQVVRLPLLLLLLLLLLCFYQTATAPAPQSALRREYRARDVRPTIPPTLSTRWKRRRKHMRHINGRKQLLFGEYSRVCRDFLRVAEWRYVAGVWVRHDLGLIWVQGGWWKIAKVCAENIPNKYTCETQYANHEGERQGNEFHAAAAVQMPCAQKSTAPSSRMMMLAVFPPPHSPLPLWCCFRVN